MPNLAVTLRLTQQDPHPSQIAAQSVQRQEGTLPPALTSCRDGTYGQQLVSHCRFLASVVPRSAGMDCSPCRYSPVKGTTPAACCFKVCTVQRPGTRTARHAWCLRGSCQLSYSARSVHFLPGLPCVLAAAMTDPGVFLWIVLCLSVWALRLARRVPFSLWGHHNGRDSFSKKGSQQGDQRLPSLGPP